MPHVLLALMVPEAESIVGTFRRSVRPSHQAWAGCAHHLVACSCPLMCACFSRGLGLTWNGILKGLGNSRAQPRLFLLPLISASACITCVLRTTMRIVEMDKGYGRFASSTHPQSHARVVG
jgi:hypothetical protein